MTPNEVTEKIIGAAIEVHRELGPGLLESAYEFALCKEFDIEGLTYKRQVPLPVFYKGHELDCGYRIDLIVEQKVIVEIKAVEEIVPVHQAQLLTYLKLSGLPLGLILNFHAPTLKQGIKRFANNFVEDSAPSAPLR